MESTNSNSLDLEKSELSNTSINAVDVSKLEDGVERNGRLWKAVLWLDSFGVEMRGVERVPPSARDHTSVKDIFFFWASVNLTIASFAVGTLGASIFDLGLIDSVLTILFFNLLCTFPVAIFSTFGKSTGLRQMIVGKFSYGSLGIYFPVTLNLIACIGWLSVNSIVGASALQAVTPDGSTPLPAPVALVLIALMTSTIALFGYKHVLAFEKYAWLVIGIIFVIMLGQSASHFAAGAAGTGSGEAASILSFAAAVSGFSLGWSSLASDYTVNFPEETSTIRVFLYTYIGVNIPLCSMEMFGAAMMTTFESKTTWGEAYDRHGLGGLLGAPLSAMGGFGKFLLVILALSIVANNIPNLYSFALTFQAYGKRAQSIPRFFLVILGTVISVALSIVGYNHFNDALSNLLVILGYWLSIYFVVLIEEHLIFRKGSFKNYDLESYNNSELLPVGYAALGATAFGILGAVLGMSSVWYTGVIGKMIGPADGFGADIGFELSGVFTAVTYPILRTLEKKYIGR